MSIFIKENREYDVIVIGGGPSGVSAAVASARRGAKTLLIESTYSLGGMATSGLVTSFAPFDDGIRRISCGIAEEIVRASNKATFGVDEDDLGWLPISPEDFKMILDKMVTDSGADICFGTVICGADSERGVVKSILGANKNGLCRYRAKAFVDCTGDADVAAFAGAEFVTGDRNGETQPATLCFILSGVNDETFRQPIVYGGNPASPIHKIRALGDKYPLITDDHLCVDKIAPGVVAFNAGHVPVLDYTSNADVSKSIMLGRRVARQFRDALAEVDPETFGNAYLVSTAPNLGVRETRRIVGEYSLTVDDYLARRTFPDEIARNCYFIDIHTTTMHTLHGEEADKERCYYEPGESHGIPFRCLIPKGYSNLLVAGRSISCERAVQASIRVMPNCFTTGEAAGLAAAMAAERAIVVTELDVSLLRVELKKNGAYFL
ncbi:MAG: FAD-dependent oxidoreductase [Clostridia bacterium]|nr:FAD-dependent oxidoreductase [Clostridia bacterium]